MNGGAYILQVALVGIFVVIAVLFAMIYFVKAQGIILGFIDKYSSSRQQKKAAQKEIQVEKAAPVKSSSAPIDSQQGQQVAGREHLSESEVAAITAAIYMLVGKPVRITSINVIPPQIK